MGSSHRLHRSEGGFLQKSFLDSQFPIEQDVIFNFSKPK